MSNPLIIYGVPFSQPVRAVLWLMLYKQKPFEMVLINPGSSSEGGSRHPDYLAKFPTGTIPSIEDKETGFVLSESHAIMCYLCNKFDWHDLYPSNHEERAKVDSYLHLHHRNVREASIGLVAPKVRKDLNFSEDFLKISQANINGIDGMIEQFTINNYQPLLLCSPLIRPHVKKLVERFIPNLVVLSHNEVAQDVRIEALGVVELSG